MKPSTIFVLTREFVGKYTKKEVVATYANFDNCQDRLHELIQDDIKSFRHIDYPTIVSTIDAENKFVLYKAQYAEEFTMFYVLEELPINY